jgi:hypothetical protein
MKRSMGPLLLTSRPNMQIGGIEIACGLEGLSIRNVEGASA